MRCVTGSVWSQMSNPHENFEVEVSFRVTGRGRVGADGLVSDIFHSITIYRLPVSVS